VFFHHNGRTVLLFQYINQEVQWIPVTIQRNKYIGSCLGKFFTLIMNTRLNQFLEVNKIMNKCQIGFRKNCRTTDHLLVLKTIIDCYKSKRKPIFTCFIDFKKAYDSVWREGLFFKLILYGCSKIFMRLMLSMYSSVNLSVKLDKGNNINVIMSSICMIFSIL
jgi:hypothetical protein